MASMVAGGLFNAFAGAGYLFQKRNKDGYGEETRRHDLALEKLEKARQEWNQKDIERQEKMAALRQERSDADIDFKNINKALKDYERVTTLVFDGKKFTPQPHIWDFYEPSDEMKEYMRCPSERWDWSVDGRVRKLYLNYYFKN